MSSASATVAQRAAILLQTAFARSIVMASLITTQSLLCSYCSYVFFKSPADTRKRRMLYIILTWTIFFFATYYQLCHLYYNFTLLTVPTTPTEILGFYSKNASAKWLTSASWMARIMVWIGDGALVYRCYIVWAGNPFVTVFMVLLYIAYIAVNLATFFVKSKSLQVAWPALSMVIHCMVTFLIGFRLLRMRGQHEAIIENFDSTLYIGAITLIAESALPYALVTIFTLVGYVNSGTSANWTKVRFTGTILYDLVTVLAPQIIIWRVNLGHTFARHTKLSTAMSSFAFGRMPTDSSGSKGSSYIKENEEK